MTKREREPVASPQATEMQTRILDAAYAQQKRREAASPQATRPERICGNCGLPLVQTETEEACRELDKVAARLEARRAAQPAAGTTPAMPMITLSQGGCGLRCDDEGNPDNWRVDGLMSADCLFPSCRLNGPLRYSPLCRRASLHSCLGVLYGPEPRLPCQSEAQSRLSTRLSAHPPS